MLKNALAILLVSAGLLGGAAAAPAAPQDEPAPKKQAPRTTPEWIKAYQAANKAHQAKEYEKAIAEYEKVTAAEDATAPAKADACYNMGCCYALLGNKEKASDCVAKSIDMGFYDFDHIKSDEDLASMRDDAKIADAMKRNQAKKDAQDAENKKKQAEQMKMMDEKMMKDLPETLEKLKDAKGAGFDFSFDLKTLDGKAISSKTIAGKVAIIDIWGTWCPPCRLEIPHFVEVAKRHAKDSFVIVGLNDEDRQQNKDAEGSAKKAADFAKKNSINYPLALIDTKTLKQVPEFQGYPTTLFIDKTGKVRLKEVGYRPLEFTDAIVKALLAEGGEKRGDAKKEGDGKKPDEKKANGE